METSIGCVYAYYVTVRLTSVIKQADYTLFWVLGVEMCINFGYAVQYILLHNKVLGNMADEDVTKWKNKKQNILTNLVTMESIEILIPLAFSMGYATMYYGPNALCFELDTGYYAPFNELKDIMQPVFEMAVLDACGALLIGVLLGKLCQINIFYEFCVIAKKHWITIMLVMGHCQFLVSTNILKKQ